MNTIHKIDRRDFVKLLGLATGGIVLGCSVGADQKDFIPAMDSKGFHPNVFIHLEKNGNITIIASRSEMGQGIRTSLASAIADELEADWKYISVKQAIGHEKYGNQNTDGSRSVRTQLTPMRKMGASAKMMLLAAAAKIWEIAIEDCSAKNHFVVNKKTKETLFFGDLVAEASLVSVPSDDSIQLKKVEDFNFIGKTLKSVDIKDFTHGTAAYGMDIRLPNMKFAAITRCPVAFGTVKKFNKKYAKEVAGVETIFELPRLIPPTGKFFGMFGGIAIIANNTWAALQGKTNLNIEWDLGANASFNSETFKKTLTSRVHSTGKLVPGASGNITTAFKGAAKIIEATYHVPFLAHSPMEVPNATAWFQGNTIEVWAPVQDPQTARSELSHFLRFPKKILQ